MDSAHSAEAAGGRFSALEQGHCVPVIISLANELKLQRTCSVNAPLRLLFNWTIWRMQRQQESELRQDASANRRAQSSLLVMDGLDEYSFFGLAILHGDATQPNSLEWHFLDLERSLAKQDRAMVPPSWWTVLGTPKRSGWRSSLASMGWSGQEAGVARDGNGEVLRFHLRVQFYPNALLFDNVIHSSLAVDTLYLQLRRDALDTPIVTEFDSQLTSRRSGDAMDGDAALYDSYDSLSQRETVRRLVLLAAYAILIEHRRCCASRIIQSVYRGLQGVAERNESPERARSHVRDASKLRRAAPFKKYFHSLLTDGHIRLDGYMSIEAIKLTRHIDALISLMHIAVERVLARMQNSVQDVSRVLQIDEAAVAWLKAEYCCESQRLAAYGMHLFRTRESLLGISLNGLAVLTRNYLLAAQFSQQNGTQSSSIEFDAERHLLVQNRFRWNEIASVRFRHDRFTVQLHSRRSRISETEAVQQFDPDWTQSQADAAAGHKTKLRLDSSRKCALLLRFCNEQLRFYRTVIEQIKRAQERQPKSARSNQLQRPPERTLAATPALPPPQPPPQPQPQPQPPPTGPYNMHVSPSDGSVTFELALLVQNSSAYQLFRDSLVNNASNKLTVNISRLSDAELNRLFARTLGFTVAKTPETLRLALRRSDPRSAATCQVDHVVEPTEASGSAIRRGDLILRVNDVNVRYFAMRYVLNVIVDECVLQTVRNRDEPNVLRLRLKRLRSQDAPINSNSNVNVNRSSRPEDAQYSYSRPRAAPLETNELAEPVATGKWSNGAASGGYRSVTAETAAQPWASNDPLVLQASSRYTPQRNGRVPDDRYKISRSQPQLSNAERQLNAPFNTPQTQAHNLVHAQLNANARAWTDAARPPQTRTAERRFGLDTAASSTPAQYMYSRPTTVSSRQHSAVPFAYAYDRPQQFTNGEFQVARFDLADHDSEIL